MRKILFAFVFMCMVLPCAWADVAVDSSNFPDETFMHYVSDNFDTDSDGVLSDSEISAVTSISVSSSNITSLEGIKYFTALSSLSCENNSITSLDVSGNTVLSVLSCYNNNLTALDLGGNQALTNVSCNMQTFSPFYITSTGDTEYPYQVDLTRYMTSEQAANISVVNGYSGNSTLSGLCENGIAKFTASPSSVAYQYATGYSTLTMDVTLSGAVYSSGGVEINAANFPDETFREYVSNNFDTDSDGVLNDSEISAVTAIDVSGQGISSLKGIEYLTALTQMDCSSNDLTSLIITANVNLTVLDCSYNQLKSLNVSRNTALTELYCKSNQLQALDVSKNNALTILECQRNQIRTLDVSNNAALRELFCQSNQLTALDLGGNTSLSEAECAPQERIGLNLISSGNASYLDELDFSSYMSSDQYANVSNVQGFDSSDNSISASYSDGIALFDSRPYAVEYTYSIGSTVPMDASDGTLTIRISDSGGVEINSTNFPDDNFRAYVSNDCDTDNDGVLSDAEIADVTYIYLNSKDIASLTGIEYFTALTDLDCQNNQLTELDVSKNTALTALDCSINQLTTLDVSNNTALTWLDCYGNSLTVLDVSNNTALTVLYCSYNQLTALDVSNNTELTDLQCYSNDLTALDVSSNTALTTLECGENQLTELDMSKNTALTELGCDDNQLTTLDVSNNAKLEKLYCLGNKLTTLNVSNNTILTHLSCFTNKLTTLDLSKNTKLVNLNCHNNLLTALDVSNNTALTSLWCFGNQLTTLDVSKNTALIALRCHKNKLTALDLSNNTSLDVLSCDSQTVSPLTLTSTGDSSYPYQLDFSAYMSSDKFANISDVQGLDSNSADISTTYANGIARFAASPAKVTYNYATGYSSQTMDVTVSDSSSSSGGVEINAENFPDDVFRSYVSSNYDTDSDGILSDTEIANVTYINVNDMGISSLKGIEYFTALTGLYCYGNQLTALDLSSNTALTTLWCYNNMLMTALDVSKNTALITLFCYHCQLTSLDVSSNTALDLLRCNQNQLTILDVSKNTALTNLDCYDNQLSELDVSKNTALTWLQCDSNMITELDVSKNTALTHLGCGSNKLTTLDVSNNTALTDLRCSSNQLTALDVSNNTALTGLYFGGNQLTAFDVSSNTALTSLDCSDNKLTALDVSNNTALTYMRCDRNQLTTLDVSKNTALTSLLCYDNGLSALDVSSNTALTELNCLENQLTALDLSNNIALVSLDCALQTVSTLNITSTGDSSYPYQLDFSGYMTSAQTANISDVQGIDSYNSNITTTYADGKAKFAATPAKVTYNYATGYSSTTMDVTISGTSDDPSPAPAPSGGLSINEANFPDSNFRSYITSNFDTDNDGVLSDTEISSITEIQADNQGIQSLSGIENFTALEYLSCGSNDLSSLNFSNNTALTYLNFWSNNISSIDLSQNTALKEIYFYDNNISSIDFSSNTELVSIDCVHNGLRYIDVSSCTKLRFLNVYDNLLTELDVTNCALLNNLSFGSNDVSAIDLSNNPLITYLGCNDNRLATLDLSGMSGDITELYMDSQMIDGMTITGTGDSSYPYQLDFSAYMSPDKFANVSDVQGIDSENGNITTTYADGIARFASRPSSVQYNYATGYGSSVMDVTISGAGLSSGDVEINATNFPDDVFREYVRTEFDTDNDGVLSESEIANVISIDVPAMYSETGTVVEYGNIFSLKGVEYFTALTSLWCEGNQLTDLDVSKNTALTDLNCAYNSLTELDVSKNTALTSLWCSSNQLTTLDVSNNTALTALACGGNQLTALDLNNNTALTYLACSDNQLTELDVSKNTALTELYCYSQTVSPLNITGTGDSSYPYQLDFSAYMTSEQTANVSDVQGLDSSGSNITTTYSSGIARFASRPSSVKYDYATGYSSRTMDVTISGDSSSVPVGMEISTTTFPDSAFRSYISANFDTDGDGALSDSEAANVTYIEVTSMDISSLTGVEYFTALTSLICDRNKLTAFDVSNNTALTYLNCSNNQLTELDVSKNTALATLWCDRNQLTGLDLSKNTALATLRCDDNQLISLDVSNNTALTYLNCSNNQLTELDVSNNTALTNLVCGGNQLTALDVSKNTALTYLDCGYSQLTLLDVSKNTALTVLHCENSRLTSLDLGNNTALTELYCDWNQLTTLDVSSCTALEVLYCEINQLAALDLSNNAALTGLYCYSQTVSPLTLTSTGDSSWPYILDFSVYMSSDKFANVSIVQGYDSNSADISTSYADGIAHFASKPSSVKYVYTTEYGSSSVMDVTISGTSENPSPAPTPSDGLSVNETNFPDSTFRSYISTNFDTDGDGSLSDSEIANVTSINVQGNGISSLRGVEYFTALTYLNCWGNQLTELDVSKNTALTTLLCGNNNLNTLDVSKNTALTELLCNYTHLTELDVSNNTALVSLDIGSNDITALDVSKNTNLRMLVFGENKLTELDVSSNTKLTQLDCSNNRLTSLDVSNNTALTRLYCHSNQLTTLDVSNNTALTDLACHWNQLKELDLSNNTALDDLVCHSNQLTALDVSNNTALIRLHCSSNQLTEFDVSRNTALEFLNFARNQIKAIDLSNNTSLTYLHCHVNKLAALDLSNNTALTELWCYSQDVFPLTITSTGDSSYPYMLDFSSYMSPDNFANVSNVQGLGANSEDIATTYADGIARFASRPQSVKYNYATAFNSTVMDVTISNPGLNISAANFPDSAFRSYISSNFDSDSNGVLSDSEISSATWINVDNMNISSLKGIEYFTFIEGLNCSGNRLTELDLSRNTALTEVWAMSNDISSLNVYNCASLRKLGLHENNLTQLDVSSLPLLEELHCGDMSLSRLALGNKPYLTQLYCYRNQLTELDVTGCTALTQLHFGWNRIARIDLSRCTALQYLHCLGNQLTYLNISGLTAITDFNGDGQSFDAPAIYSTGDSDYPYRVDLSAYVTSGNLANVVNVLAYDSSGSAIDVIYENGTAYFASFPSRIDYTYSTGRGNMSVSASYGNAEVISDVTPNPTPNPTPDNTTTDNNTTPGTISGQFTAGGHRYALYDIKMSWTDAQEYCESLGGYLATITTQEEQDALSSAILSSSGEAYWLGGHRDSTGAWSWLDGSRWNYTNWDTNSGQPDNSGERLLVYGPAYSGNNVNVSDYYASDEFSRTPGRWGSVSENTDASLYGFICEWDQQTQLEVAVVSPIPEVTESLRQRLARLVSIDESEVNFITSAEIDPSEPREPTLAMQNEMARRDCEFMAKLNTIKVKKDGWYALMITVSDDLVGTNVNDLRLFYADDSDFAAGAFSASFGLMPLVNGVAGGLEITDLFGVQLDTLPKQFVAMLLLSSGKSLSVYIIKILLLLLAGCSAGAGSLILLAVFIYKRHSRKK